MMENNRPMSRYFIDIKKILNYLKTEELAETEQEKTRRKRSEVDRTHSFGMYRGTRGSHPSTDAIHIHTEHKEDISRRNNE